MPHLHIMWMQAKQTEHSFMQFHFLPDQATLGNLLAEHRPPWRKLLFVIVIVTVLCSALLWWYLQKTPLPIRTTGGILLFLFSMAAIGGIAVYRRYSRRVLVFDEALVDIRGDKVGIYRWDQINQIQAYDTTYNGFTQCICTIRHQDGRKLTFKTNEVSLSDDNMQVTAIPALTTLELIIAIIQLAYPPITMRSIAHYQNGGRLDFKKLQISYQGIHIGQHTLPWSQVEDINGDGNVLIIKAVGQSRAWRVLTIADIPNRDALPPIIVQTQGRQFSAFVDEDQGEKEVSEEQLQELQATYRRLKWRRRLQALGVVLLFISIRAGFSFFHYYLNASGHIDRGSVLMGDGDYQGALEEFNQAAAIEPDNEKIYALRCFVYRQLGKFDEARADCQQALALRPGYPLALVHLARVYHRQGDYQQALAIYEDAIAKHPTYYYIYCSRAYSYKRMGLKDKAIADFSTCHTLTKIEWWKTESEKQIQELQSLP